MEAILLGIYAFFVWLIFIKLKLLPWTTPWKVGVVIFPVVVLAATIAAAEHLRADDHRCQGRQVRRAHRRASEGTGDRSPGREQPAGEERRRPVPDRPDTVRDRGSFARSATGVGRGQGRGRTGPGSSEVQTRLPDAESTERQLDEQLRQATNQIAALQASLELAKKRVAQNTELAASGAGNRFDLEQAQTNTNELTAQIAEARAAEQEVREKLSGRVKGDLAAVAGAKAQISTAQAQVRVAQAQADTTRAKLENARWNLEQTTVVAPADGTMVNVMLRPGYFVSGIAFNEVMTFVDTEYQVFAMFSQNELHQVAAGQEAEITLDTYPGRIVKAHVDSVIWAQAQGEIEASGDLPRTTFTSPPGKFPVKLVVAEHDNALFLAAGARGAAAIYTEHLALIHLIRKVLIRTSSYLDYIIIKHHISLH